MEKSFKNGFKQSLERAPVLKPMKGKLLKCYRVAKCDVTKIKICKLMGLIEIIQANKTKNVLAKNQPIGANCQRDITSVIH